MTPSDGTQRSLRVSEVLQLLDFLLLSLSCELQRTSQKPSIPGLVDGRLGTGCASNGIKPLDHSVKILAIRLARFGDLVLLLPALALLKARLPDSHLTLLTDTRWGPLAEMCPAIDQVITVDRIKMRDGPAWRAIAGMLRLLRDLRRRRFDATQWTVTVFERPTC